MLVLIFLFFALVSTDSVYFSGYRNSFKILPIYLSNTNIILSSPHAGSDMPEDIPDRTIGGCRRDNSTKCTFNFNDSCSNGIRCSVTTVQDFAGFDTFTEQVVNELNKTYNLIPSVIIAKWNRKKIDFNREINEATFNHPQAIKSHRRYHNYLKKAIHQIEQKFNGNGLLLDIHQHGRGK
jgi:N-formylglutamate amidohydrolase